MISKQDIADILKNESFNEVIDSIIQEHLNVITYSNDDETEIRERAYQRIKTTKELLAHLQSIVDSSKIEDARWKI
jgi:ADP-heptose:LPS heptosyltransferase